MNHLEQARTYLARVLPWPQEGDAPAFVNIHWTFRPKDGNVKKDRHGKELLPWTGRACRSVAEASKALEWAIGSESTRDIYACLSTQRNAIEQISGRGFKWQKPIREQSNAVALKALFLDIDFKGGDHGYDTSAEAVTALGKFLGDTGLPKPSLAVGSGGGLHVYWVLDRALAPNEWLPLSYALAEATKRHGLKCDTQCTIDSVRVLRIPNTFNHKTNPPRPVRLIGQPTDFDLSTDKIAEILRPYETAIPKGAKQTVLDPILFPPRPPLPGDSDLCAGIDAHRFKPLDPKGAIAGCAFLRDALTTGGKDYTNPLWNLTTLIATFCDDGRKLAHNMGRKHPGYSKETTDELFDRKAREKDEKGLGWPACATISGSGCAACQSCPHFSKGQTPLHLAIPAAPKAVPPAVTQLPQGVTISDDDLPQGYSRRADGVICQLLEDEEGATIYFPICNYPMYDPWVQKNPWALHFTTITNRPTQISVPTDIINTHEMRRVLQGQFVMLHGKTDARVGEFFVSWLEKLKDSKDRVVSTSPFGWNVRDGKTEGFVYDGHVWSPGGSRKSPTSDPVLANHYAPTGSRAAWSEAVKLVIDQGRPSLNAIIASSFGSPLVKFTGQLGLLMSAYSEESGIGKTTAMKIAQAVWGDPIRAMQGLSDTQNAVLHKIGELQSLPVYWDELKTDKDTSTFVNTVFKMSSGRDKARLNRSVEQRELGTWQMIMVSASNESLLDYVTSQTKMTTAGLYRVFEYVVEPPANRGIIAPSSADRILAGLNNNYGRIGREYAEFLGSNHVRIDKDVGDFGKELGVAVSAHQEERFWTALITSVCLGARYAKELGIVDLDEKSLRAFMIASLNNMRSERNMQPVDMKNQMNVSNVLAQFFNAMRARHTLQTNHIHTSPGKPPVGSVTVVADASRLENIAIHLGRTDKRMRISVELLREWLEEKNYSRHQFMRAIESEFGVKRVRGRIGSGTQYVGATEYLLELDIAGSPLLNFIDEA